MAKKIKIKVLQDTQTYEQLLPETIAEQVTYDATRNVKEVISEVSTNASEAKSMATSAQSSVDTLSTTVSGIATTVSNLGTTVAQHEQRITNVESNITIINNSVVAASSWNDDTSYTDYPFKANISITSCTTNHVPDVYFGITEATSGKFAPIAQSYAGGVSIWASEKPEASITIPTIKLIKQS